MSVATGLVTAFHLFDIAESADLAAVPALVSHDAAPAVPLGPTPSPPRSVQYHLPPLMIDGAALGVQPIDGYHARAKLFSCGVLSLALTKPFSGTWDDLLALGEPVGSKERLRTRAYDEAVRIAARLAPALTRPKRDVLSDTYLVFSVTSAGGSLPADTLLARHGEQIARLLRGEQDPLSVHERQEVLRHALSYLADDLVVPTWNAAFVYDTEGGTQAALEIIEHTCSQALQFRSFDALLDGALARVYATLQHSRWRNALGPGQLATTRELHRLLLGVNGLTGTTANALRFVGDVYAARLYELVAARLGLERWKQSVAERMRVLEDLYRFSLDQTQLARRFLLELTIVSVLMLQLVLVFLIVLG